MRTTLSFPYLLWSLFFTGGLFFSLSAQSDKALLRQLAEQNQQTVDALVLYPDDVRRAVLEATQYPAALVRLQQVQQQTSAAFRTLIEDFPRTTQETFFDLTRYPGLLDRLAATRGRPAEIATALTVLPDDRRAAAQGVVERQWATVEKIGELRQTADRAAIDLLADYPAAARSALHQLVELPEVLELLTTDWQLTLLAGDVYRQDPDWVLHKMDSLHLAAARAHSAALDDWRAQLQNDPEARRELQTAADEYARERGYTAAANRDDLYAEENYYDDDYAAPGGYDDRPDRIVYAYPYWFGYPWWMPEPCWRPYPWWWDWGFYPYHHTVVIVHLPSYHFMHWYFDRPHHHHKYNHLSTHFVRHYYGHRRSGSTIDLAVHDWQQQHRTVISDEFLADNGRLPERLREYGRFEDGRRAFNAANPGRKLSEEDYLRQNGRNYPELEKSRQEAALQVDKVRAGETPARTWAPTKPPANPEPAERPEPGRRDRPVTEPAHGNPEIPAHPPKTETPDQPVRPKTDEPRKPEKPKIDEARDYHRERWNEVRRSEEPRRNEAPQNVRKPEPVKKPEVRPPAAKPPSAPKTKTGAPSAQKQRGG